MSNQIPPPPPPSNWPQHDSPAPLNPGSSADPTVQRPLYKKKRFWAVAIPVGLMGMALLNPAQPSTEPVAAPAPTVTVTATQTVAAPTVTATATATATVTAMATTTATATVTAEPPLAVVEQESTSEQTNKAGFAQPAVQQTRESDSGSTDPRFDTCKKANAAGYGPYQQGQDPEYDWYRDSDNDGVNCEPQ